MALPRPGDKALPDLEALGEHYGLQGLAYSTSAISLLSPSAAWMAATAGLPADHNAMPAAVSRDGKDASVAVVAHSREWVAATIAHDLAWKVQVVAAAACSALIDVHERAAVLGMDATAAIRAAAAGGAPGSAAAAGLTGAVGVPTSGRPDLQRAQTLTKCIGLQRRALDPVSAAAQHVHAALWHQKQRAATVARTQNQRTRQGVLAQQQVQKPVYVPFAATPAAVEAGRDSYMALQRAGPALWVLLITGAAWGALPPKDLHQALMSPREFERQVLVPASTSRVRMGLMAWMEPSCTFT